jgi:hypothetical protein
MDPKLQEGAPPVDEEQLKDVEVPEDPTDPAAPKVVDLDEEDANDAAYKQLDNKAFAAMRREAAEAKRERDELKKKMAEYEEQARQPAPPIQPPQYSPHRQREVIGGIPVPETKAEWDALARQDWQAAVDLRSIIKARQVQDEVQRTQESTRIVEESKQRVLQRHPELEDDRSEKTIIFKQILEKNPEYLRMNKGPILAMRDMEDVLESRGYTRDQIFDSKKVVAQNEATRVNRATLTGGGRMPEKAGRTVQLSKDDLEFCRLNDLDPKDYAKEKLALETNKKGA